MPASCVLVACVCGIEIFGHLSRSAGGNGEGGRGSAGTRELRETAFAASTDVCRAEASQLGSACVVWRREISRGPQGLLRDTPSAEGFPPAARQSKQFVKLTEAKSTPKLLNSTQQGISNPMYELTLALSVCTCTFQRLSKFIRVSFLQQWHTRRYLCGCCRQPHYTQSVTVDVRPLTLAFICRTTTRGCECLY